MAARNIKIRSEDKSAASDYLLKAKENYMEMISSLENKRFNAASTLIVQCVISSADAICVFEKGVRSISQDHLDVCELVSSLTIPGAAEKALILKKIIAKKNVIQYERRNILETEARDMAKLTARFYQWVEGQISNVKF